MVVVGLAQRLTAKADDERAHAFDGLRLQRRRNVCRCAPLFGPGRLCRHQRGKFASLYACAARRIFAGATHTLWERQALERFHASPSDSERRAAEAVLVEAQRLHECLLCCPAWLSSAVSSILDCHLMALHRGHSAGSAKGQDGNSLSVRIPCRSFPCSSTRCRQSCIM